MIAETIKGCPCKGRAELIQMYVDFNEYLCACSEIIRIPVDNSKTCVICGDTDRVSTGDPCPICEERFLSNILRY